MKNHFKHEALLMLLIPLILFILGIAAAFLAPMFGLSLFPTL